MSSVNLFISKVEFFSILFSIFSVICNIEYYSSSNELNNYSMCSTCSDSDKVFDELDDDFSTSSNIKKIFKIVLFGDSNVGKSQIYNVYNNQSFKDKHRATLGVDFIKKNINENYALYLWDSAGDERKRTISGIFRNADVVIFCYDITNKTSFYNISKWLELAKQENNGEEFTAVLCGTKKDLEIYREVKIEEGEQFAEENNMQFFEVSAKEGKGINEMFENIYREVILVNDCNY